MDLTQQMQQDRGVAVSEEGLQRLSLLAEQQLGIEKELLEIAERAKYLGTKLKEVSEEKIPSLMTELGVSEFKLTSGAKVSVKPFYSASLPKDEENRNKAFSWLKEHGHDDIIKNEVKAAFGRGEEKRAELAMSALRDAGIEAENTKNIHPQTLKAFVREQVESGSDIPYSTFNIFVGRKSKIEGVK